MKDVVFHLALACVVLACVASAQTRAALPLTMLTEGHCLDGSPYGFYYSPATSAVNATKWAIWLEFGGFCYDAHTCAQHLTTHLGSSTQFPTSVVSQNALSPSSTLNPNFYDWAFVYLPYCTGDFHSGTRTEKNEDGLFFSGHNNIMAAIDYLKANHAMGDATEIVLTGASAGGYGTFINSDAIANAVPNAKTYAVPQSGLFLYALDYPAWTNVRAKMGDSHSAQLGDADFSLPCTGGAMLGANLQTLYETYQAYVNPRCVTSVGEDQAFHCFSPVQAYSYSTVPTFIVESRYDGDQIFVNGGAPHGDIVGPILDYTNYFGACMNEALDQVKDRKMDGYFVSDCMSHVMLSAGSQATIVQGSTPMQAISAWYPHGALKIEDTCGSAGCNPTCGAPYYGMPSSSSGGTELRHDAPTAGHSHAKRSKRNRILHSQQ